MVIFRYQVAVEGYDPVAVLDLSQEVLPELLQFCPLETCCNGP